MDQFFQFKYPWVLLLIIILPLLELWRRKCGGKKNALGLSCFSLLPKGSGSKSAEYILKALRFLAMLLLIIAIARPTLNKSKKNINRSGVDIILLLDISSSMLVRDFPVSQFESIDRMSATKAVVASFIKSRQNDRLGLIGFAKSPYLVSPLTYNHAWLLKNLNRLKPGIIEDGTAIGSAIAMGANRLRDLESKSRIIILLTDGNNNCGSISPNMAAELAETFDIKVYCIAANGMSNYPIDTDTLKAIAGKTGGKFYQATDVNELTDVYSEIDALERTKVKMVAYVEGKDIFVWFAGLALILLLLEFLLAKTVLRVLP